MLGCFEEVAQFAEVGMTFHQFKKLIKFYPKIVVVYSLYYFFEHFSI